jgi:PAS domain S-box-containing protein
MRDHPIRVLVIGDDAGVGRALERTAAGAAPAFHVDRVAAGADASRRLAEGAYDMCVHVDAGDAPTAASIGVDEMAERVGTPVLHVPVARFLDEIRALEESRAHYKALYEDSPDMSAVIHARSRTVIECNRRLARSLGLEPSGVVGRHVAALHEPGCGPAIDDLFVRLESADEVRDAELRLRFADGEPVDVSVDIVRVSPGDGTRLRATWRDISRRKAAERQLVSFAHELERSNRELEQFAYVASHDLREPLRMVASYLQLLERRYASELDADAREFIGFAVDGAHRMQRLIADLLAYSRAGNRELSPVRVDARGVVEEVLRDLGRTVDETGATVEIGELPVVTADATHLRQLFQNLITNALKFRSREAPRVRIEAAPAGSEWRFTITDNGVGVPPEERERVFRVFQRLHGQEKYPGTGIGLAICKRIVERHGGRIEVEPAPGGGSTFSFTFPRIEEATDDLSRAA